MVVSHQKLSSWYEHHISPVPDPSPVVSQYGIIYHVNISAVVYVGGLRRYRANVNNDNGATVLWELAQSTPPNGGNAA